MTLLANSHTSGSEASLTLTHTAKDHACRLKKYVFHNWEINTAFVDNYIIDLNTNSSVVCVISICMGKTFTPIWVYFRPLCTKSGEGGTIMWQIGLDYTLLNALNLLNTNTKA